MNITDFFLFTLLVVLNLTGILLLLLVVKMFWND
mgnify:CR=1 FL=1